MLYILDLYYSLTEELGKARHEPERFADARTPRQDPVLTRPTPANLARRLPPSLSMSSPRTMANHRRTSWCIAAAQFGKPLGCLAEKACREPGKGMGAGRMCSRWLRQGSILGRHSGPTNFGAERVRVLSRPGRARPRLTRNALVRAPAAERPAGTRRILRRACE